MFLITREMQLRSNLRYAMKNLFALIAQNDLTASLSEMRRLEKELTQEMRLAPDNELAYCLINFSTDKAYKVTVALLKIGKLKNNQFLDF
jgi:hypothetical protein